MFKKSSNFSPDHEIDKTFQLLEEGRRKIKAKNGPKNVTIVLGNTGSGKSTFVQWLAGDGHNLISKEVKPNSGLFIIEDGQNRIDSTINSKTTFPELVIDMNTHDAFYDCPGFNDTRSTANDISNNFFIKEITCHNQGVKLVLVVNYSSVTEGVDRSDFVKLLKHTTSLIRDIHKYENSFALVVTKVNNIIFKRGGNYLTVPDETMIATISGYLKNVREALSEQGLPNEDNKTLANAIKLLDIFLTVQKGNYTRIALFRRPDEEKPLSSIKILVNEKQRVESMLRKLQFSNVDQNDFGFALSETSEKDINAFVDAINNQIWNDVSELIDKVQNHYEKLFDNMKIKIHSFVKRGKIVQADVKDAQNFEAEIRAGEQIADCKNESLSIIDLSNAIQKKISRLGLKTCQQHVENISFQARYIEFLEKVSGEELKTRQWSVLFQKLQKFLNVKKEKFYNEANLLLKELLFKNQKLMENFGKCVEEYYTEKIISTDVETILIELKHGKQMVANWIGNLNNLSEETSNSALDFCMISSDSNRIPINAQYITFLNVFCRSEIALNPKWTPLQDTQEYLSDWDEFMRFLKNLYDKLSEYKIQSQKGKYNVANLDDWGVGGKTAGIRITENNFPQFIDKIEMNDFSKKEMKLTKLHLALLNPVLDKTLGNYSFFSEGDSLVIYGDSIHFKNFVEPCGKIGILSKYKSAHVIIIAMKRIVIDRDVHQNGLQLSIIAPTWKIIGKRVINIDGAPGGAHGKPKADDGRNPGENGDEGKPGLPGEPGGNFLGIGQEFDNCQNLTISAVGGCGGCGQHGGDGMKGKVGNPAQLESSEKKALDFNKVITFFYNRTETQYKVIGEKGGKGGKGGDGGTAGLGGMSGNVKILPLGGNTVPITIKIGWGLVGSVGNGGLGGEKGPDGADLKATEVEHNLFLFIPLNTIWDVAAPGSRGNSELEKVADGTAGKSEPEKAADGTAGKSEIGGRQQPRKGKNIQNIANTLRIYKKYLRKNLLSYFKTKTSAEFLHNLENNTDIKKSYNTEELVLEFLDLETIHHANKPKFLNFYVWLLNTTREHTHNTSDYKTLRHLYAAILSRIITLKKTSESYLVIDLDNYFNLVVKNINELRNLRENCNKLKIINQYRDSYKTKLEMKVKEALNFIESQLTPEMQDIFKQIKFETGLILQETHAKQLKNNQRTVNKTSTSIWSKVLFGLKIFSEVLSFFGWFKLGLGLFGVAQVAESAILPNENSTIQLQSGVKSFMNSISSEFTSLTRQNDVFKKQNKKGSSKLETEDELTSKLVKITTDAVEFCKLCFSDDGKKAPDEKIARLEKYKTQIYQETVPSLEKGAKEMNSLINQLPRKSQTEQWRIQTQLRTHKTRLLQFSEVLSIDHKMRNFIEKLNEVMNTLIQVYERLQDYHDQQELAEYIADVNSPADMDVNIANLDLIIHSNLITEQHRTAVNALTQHVFPFASYFLGDFKLVQADFPSQRSLEHLVEEAAQQVKRLHSKLTEYKSLIITDHDKLLGSGWFTRDFKSSEPFFVWENSENRCEIKKLLSGEKVILNANILNGVLDKDAVKFNRIGINFHSEDAKITSEILKKLEGFEVSATHLGNSYYKYSNKIYLISSDRQNITFSFEKDKEGEPVHKNHVYNKIRSGDLMLSPYAMWEFQLSGSKSQFQELQMYKDVVDLELVGYGSYLTSGANVPELDVDSYYMLVQTIS